VHDEPLLPSPLPRIGGTTWALRFVALAITVAACILLMLVFGYAGTEAALRVRPAAYLRNE